ncbi:MAG: T9SS type A sorting domain-containing protein, partial [bacterium]
GQTSGTTGELTSVHFANANVGTIVGFGGLILRTTNGGAAWIPQTSGTANPLRGVHLLDANIGVAVGIGGVIRRTTNGGTNWTSVTSGAKNDLYSIHFVNSMSGFAVGTAKILRTSDAGLTWTNQPNGVSGDLYAVHFSDIHRGGAVGQVGVIVRTANGGGATSVDDALQNLPQQIVLYQSYPNPFNPSTKIRYSLPSSQFVTLKVFDMLGRELETLVQHQEQAGEHEISFDAFALASGVYYYRLSAGSFSSSRRMLLLK